MRHEPRNPFPFTTPKGDIIVDEVCRCTHSRHAHRPTFAFGHGACMAGSGKKACKCKKFSWRSFVYKPLVLKL